MMLDDVRCDHNRLINHDNLSWCYQYKNDCSITYYNSDDNHNSDEQSKINIDNKK